MAELLENGFFLFGSLFILISGLGILKMPDPLSRAHAVTKALTLGIISILVGVSLHFQTPLIGFKMALAILFQLLTIPLAGHIFALLAYKKK